MGYRCVYLGTMTTAHYLVTSVFLLLMVGSRSATAQTVSTPPIEWGSLPSCTSADKIETRLASILTRSAPAPSSIRCSVAITRDGERWRVTIEVKTADRQYRRSVAAVSCEVATELSALLIALVLDPTEILASTDPDVQADVAALTDNTAAVTEKNQATNTSQPKDGGTSPTPLPGSREGRSDDEGTEDADQPSPSESPEEKNEQKEDVDEEADSEDDTSPDAVVGFRRFQVGVAATLDVGILPKPAPGVALFGAYRHRRFTLQLATRYLPPRRFEAADPDGASWSPQIVGLSLSAGAVFTLKRFLIIPVVGGTALAIFVRSTGSGGAKSGAEWTGTAWLGTTLEWAVLDWFGIRFEPSVHVLFTRPVFQFEDVQTKEYQMTRVTGVFALGVFFAF